MAKWISPLIITLVFSFQSLAQSEVVDIDENFTDTSLEEELSSANFEAIDKISQKIQKARDDRFRKLNIRPPKVNPWSPKPFRARIKTGAVITDVKTDKDYVVKKPMYVVAREQIEGGHRSFLYTQNNEIKYVVDTRFLASVEEDLNLSPRIDASIIYDKPDLTGAQEKFIPLETQLLFSFESLDGTYYAQNFRGSQTRASGERYEGRAYYNNNWDLQFGANLNIGRGSWNDEELGTASWINTFIGPSMRYRYYQTEENSSSVHLSAAKSIYFQSQKLPDRHKYSATNWQLDVDYTFKTSLGVWAFNAAYRVMQMSIKESSEYLETDPSLRTISSLSIGLGYIWNFNL